VSDQVSRLLGIGSTRRPGSEPAAAADLRSGIVTRLDPDGSVWVTPNDGDTRSPIGPCRGARRPRLVQTSPGAYDLLWRPLDLRTPVLFATTSDGVWIVSHDTKGN
jgi:hypothetical protein